MTGKAPYRFESCSLQQRVSEPSVPQLQHFIGLRQRKQLLIELVAEAALEQAVLRRLPPAAAHLGKAIALADKLAATAPSAATASTRLHLQTSLGNALIWSKGHQAPEASAAFARARELASR